MSVLSSESKESVTNRHQLLGYFQKACKPKDQWLIGCEHEKFPYRLSTLKPVSYGEPAGMRDFLQALQQYGWAAVLEDNQIIGLSRGHSAISFEPGAQLELAGAPLRNLHEVAAELNDHLAEIHQIGHKLGVGFLNLGFHPTAKREDIAWVPKDRYRIMRQYMPKVGLLGHDMMLRTCTVQVNLDFSDEADMVKKFRASLALQPIATALFASSPFTEGKPNGFNSYRMHMWSDTDNNRSGNTPFAFEKDFGFERYIDYALDVPMYFVWRAGKYIDCTGQSFRDFMAGKLPALPGALPNMTDWANHLTTLFPDVRLKKILEMRGADTGPAAMLMALPAFWTGLLYDATSLEGALELTKTWTAEARKKLRADVPRLGLKADVEGRKVLDVARDALHCAEQGLRARSVKQPHGEDETRYLHALMDIVSSGENNADQLLSAYKNTPDFMGQKLFDRAKL